MSQYYVVTVMAEDRVGIIHGVSQAISNLHGDITDISQTVLRGYFTMILLVTFDAADVTREALLTDLNAALEALDLDPVVGVKTLGTLPQTTRPPDPRDTYVLSATGEDRIGFVATVTGFCAQQGINVLDLETRVEDTIYLMLLLVDLGKTDTRDVQAKLAAFADETGLALSLQHHDVFQATQEIRMP